jgi:hypothetical protein
MDSANNRRFAVGDHAGDYSGQNAHIERGVHNVYIFSVNKLRYSPTVGNAEATSSREMRKLDIRPHEAGQLIHGRFKGHHIFAPEPPI